MELGVDIASSTRGDAQRTAHARQLRPAFRPCGPFRQPALVITYCSTGSAHDQYYFRRSGLMVSGSVAPPRIDLTNEDLLRSHVQAVWLAETQVPWAPR